MSNTDGALIWINTSFEELDANRLYQILSLRFDVFVIEQNCNYQDLDYKDQHAVHLQCYHNEELVAYCRLFNKGDYYKDAVTIGRVVVSKSYRKLALGHQLLEKAIALVKEMYNEDKIIISAQLYLQKFYESHGFSVISETYLDAGIPHVKMQRL